MVIIKFLKFLLSLLKFALLIAALGYLICIAMQFTNAELLEKISKYVGFLPDFFDTLIKQQNISQINSLPFELGYIVTCIFFFVLMLLSSTGIGFCDDLINENLIAKKEKEINKHVKEELIREKTRHKKLITPEVIYGLFEFVFKGEDTIDLEDLKKKYTSTLFSKLNSKYNNFEFTINKKGKIEFKSKDFSKFDMLTDEILRFYSAFLGINNTFAKLHIKFSMCGANGKDDKKTFKFLEEINKLEYLNKILISEELAVFALKNKFSRFNFLPLGTTKLIKKFQKDYDVDLFRLSNPHTAKRNDK
ncbi:hypothetical protein IJ670_05875 [bacterium]|nr:hypothetical protein [bacterium]